MSQRKELKQAYRLVAKKLKQNESKSGGPNNRNVDKQLHLISMEMGKLSKNLVSASENKNNQERYEAYFKGMKNSAASVAARAVALVDYLERHFNEDGTIKEKDNNSK